MKHVYNFIISVLVLASLSAGAQTFTNVQKLNQLSEEYTSEWEAKQLRVQEYARLNNALTIFETEGGVLYQMVDVVDGKPVYYKTDNLGAAKTTRAIELWEDGSTGLSLSGEGYNQLGEWDGGAVLTTHQEFTDQGASRVTVMDGTNSTHYHATHVGGTLIAAGIIAEAKGMAFAGNLKSYDWQNDLSEMANAAANGMEISNHSYGSGAGWENNGNWYWLGNSSLSPTEDYKFGFYDQQTRQLDQIAYNAPNYLIFRSAGNERGEGPGNAGTGDEPEIDGGEDHYDCIQPEKGAKNVMTIGAVHEVANYTGPEDVTIASFSSRGPMDDGRIKPDIVAKGVSVYSTYNTNNTSYNTLGGTSMSTPNSAGSATLLQVYYQDVNDGVPMRSATLKGLIIHTADEAGEHEGPDYFFGWGLFNAERAANVITEDTVQNVIEELVLEDGNNFNLDVEAPGESDLRVTICWTDPAATVLAPALNSRTPMLVNNLNMLIQGPDREIYYPYSLNPDDPSAAATTDAKNMVDNVEMIYIPDAVAGTYTIFIDHEGTLTNNSQAFSLIMSGIDDFEITPDCSSGLNTPENNSQDVFANQEISWTPASFAFSYDVYFGTDGDGTTTPTNIYNGENMLSNSFSYLMELGTTYYLQVIPRNSVGPAENCNEIWSFTTVVPVSEYPYFLDMSETDVPEIPYLWQTQDYSDANWGSTNLVGHNDNKSMLCFNPAGIVETDYDNWFISLPFSVEVGKEYYLTSFYKNMIFTHAESMSLYWGYQPTPEALENNLFTNENFDSQQWLMSESLIIPDEDGVIYVGWHAESEAGFGIVLDDILLEDWGTVGTIDRSADDTKIHAYSGKVYILANEKWNGADVQIINALGQLVYSGKYNNQMTIDLAATGNNGLFIVTINNGMTKDTKKVMIN